MKTTLPPFACTALLALARRYMEQQPSQILGVNGDEYIRRWFLEKCRSKGSVYIHHTLRSDADEELHDHPGDNMSIVLSGEIREITEDGTRILRPGDIVVRKAEDRHRLELDDPAITIWIMGERIRDWGFWLSDGRFVLSQEFFAMRGYS